MKRLLALLAWLVLAVAPASAQSGWVAGGLNQGIPFNNNGLLGWVNWTNGCVLQYQTGTAAGAAGGYPVCAPISPTTIAAGLGFLPQKVINPMYFGAKCDGVTADDAGINAAIAALTSGSTLVIPGTCAHTGQIVFPQLLTNITINGGTLLYTGTNTSLTPIWKMGSLNNAVCKGQGWIINGLRVQSATQMTSGVGLQVGDMCRTQFNGLIAGDQNSGGFIGPGNQNFWDAVEVAGGNTIRFDAMVARGQHAGVRAHGDVTAGPSYTNLTDITFNSLSALGSAYGVNISGAVGGILLDNGGDYLNNSLSNVRISQDDIASPNAQIFLSDIPIDGTATSTAVGLDLADPGNGSYLVLNGTWLSYAQAQCFLVESTASSWVIQMNGGQIITCGSSGTLPNAAFDNESTSANVHIHFAGTLFNKNTGAKNLYNNPSAGNPLDLQAAHFVDTTTAGITGAWGGSLIDSGNGLRVVGYAAAQLKSNTTSVLITPASGANACIAAPSGIGIWVQPGQVIPGDPTCSVGGGTMNLGSSTYPWANAWLTSATLSGTLSAVTGTFSGALSAASGTISGALSAASATVSGNVTTGLLNAKTTAGNAGLEVTDTTSGHFLFFKPETATNVGQFCYWTGSACATIQMGGNGIQLVPVTVATLPTCNAASKGTFSAVTDATSPTYNGALTGGGAVGVPVYCNGTAWTAH